MRLCIIETANKECREMTEQELLERQSKMEAYIAELEGKVTKMQKSNGRLKVTEKGGVSLYGLGRFPVTLYKSQWDKLLAMAPEIADFIETNKDRLAVKE